MRNALIPVMSLWILGLSACAGSPDALAPSFGAGSQSCNLALSYSGTGTLTPDANSAGNRATWLIQNKGTRAVRLKDQILSSSGAVTAVHAEAWVRFPYNLAAGAQVTSSLSFDVGASGTGTVGMTVSSGCGSLVLPGQSVTIPASGPTGVLLGPTGMFASSTTLHPVAPFNVTLTASSASNILGQINAARTNRIKLLPAMTGGNHFNYITDGKFDLAKWQAKMNTFNTDAIKAGVADAVADGTIPFTYLMDEPNDADWGGVMTHALLDDMSRYVKAIFPTLKTGVAVRWDWQKTSAYESVDVLVSQYSVRQGDVRAYRDSAAVSALRQNTGLMLAMNVLDGGKQLGPACPLDQTGGAGTNPTDINCSMTAAEIQTFGDVLVSEPTACGLLMFAWNDAFMTAVDNRAAFDHLAATAAGRAAKPCGK
jgi:hypothetical protein